MMLERMLQRPCVCLRLVSLASGAACIADVFAWASRTPSETIESPGRYTGLASIHG